MTAAAGGARRASPAEAQAARATPRARTWISPAMSRARSAGPVWQRRRRAMREIAALPGRCC